MKLLNFRYFLIVLLFVVYQKSEAKTVLSDHSKKVSTDSIHNENEALFYRVGENQLLELIYNEIFGEHIGSTVLWLNIFSDEALSSFSNSDYMVLENNSSGGFEIYDEKNNFVVIAPDLQDYYSLETGKGKWVKSRTNGFNKTYFTNDKGKEYTMTFKFSLGGKKTIKDENGYEINLNGKINGNYDITDNEGRKIQIKVDRSGVYRLIEGEHELKKMVAQSIQSFNIIDRKGNQLNIRKRGRFNDLILSFPDGREVFIRNRFKKLLPTTKEEIKN